MTDRIQIDHLNSVIDTLTTENTSLKEEITKIKSDHANELQTRDTKLQILQRRNQEIYDEKIEFELLTEDKSNALQTQVQEMLADSEKQKNIIDKNKSLIKSQRSKMNELKENLEHTQAELLYGDDVKDRKIFELEEKIKQLESTVDNLNSQLQKKSRTKSAPNNLGINDENKGKNGNNMVETWLFGNGDLAMILN